jgi:hypothetical protein
MAGRSINKNRPGFAAAAVIALMSACSAGQVQRSDLVAGPVLAPAPQLQSPLAEQMRQDPGQRLVMMERMRRQILHRTRDIPADRYLAQVRPDLKRQLTMMGFDAHDADVILTDVDRAR